MSKAGVTAAVIVLAAILVGAGFYIMVLSKNSAAVGFGSTELNQPDIRYAQAIDNSLPTPLTSSIPAHENINLNWTITEDIYVGYGGALELSVQNNNLGKLYVYAFGLEWISSGSSYFRNCSITIDHGQTVDLGLLIFGAPMAGNRDYTLVIKAAISDARGSAWHDIGEMPSTANTALVRSLNDPAEYVTELNAARYYNRINERVSYSDAAEVADSIKVKYPGNYSILQIAEAFTWVKQNVEYVTDASGDYWQSTKETLDLRTGDCEDHAILMASLIGALGGSARVNLIEGHAFPTVFVASTYADLMKVKLALASYYGLDATLFKMAYLVDGSGYWLVIDTTGFPYAGGIPAQSEPTSAAGNWTILSTYLDPIDATGVTVGNGVFGLF
jgi:hypothetical protein